MPHSKHTCKNIQLPWYRRTFRKHVSRSLPWKAFMWESLKRRGKAFVYKNTLLTNTNMPKASIKHFPAAEKKWLLLEFSNHSSIYYGQHTLNSTGCLDEKRVSEKGRVWTTTYHQIRKNCWTDLQKEDRKISGEIQRRSSNAGSKKKWPQALWKKR